MKKDEISELIVTGFGVYLLVLAIIAITKMLEGIIMLGFYLVQGSWWVTGGGDTIGNVMTTVQTAYISSSLGAVIRFAIYIVASINFLRSGSWVKRLMRRNPTAEQDIGQVSSEAAPSAPPAEPST